MHSSWHNNIAQIDLVIDRDDRIINLCEIKFHNAPFTINKTEYDTIKNKITAFKESSKTRKNVFVTMITTYAVSENANSLELITNNLTMDCLFKPV